MKCPLFALACLILAMLPRLAQADLLLLMAEEDGCYWCQKWYDEIGIMYPKTVEGKIAPIWSFNIRTELPSVTLSKDLIFTPTFILTDNGQEIGRIEGYPGEDFFWARLGMLFDAQNISLEIVE